ncbi:MAG: hypothetical protein Q8P25_00800 [Candidatus Curtissbacteria bacterium]|nr:hypothetical protein [Candidatus Curtissbacteria bacterium]
MASKKEISNKETIKYLILFAIFVAVILGIYYIGNSDRFKGLRGQQEDVVLSPEEYNFEENPEVLDCTKKLVQDKGLLARDQKSDCLFIGCGDFFQ